MARWIKCWLHMYEGENMDPQSPCESQIGLAATCNPSTGKTRHRASGARRPAVLTGVGEFQVCWKTLP